MVIFSAITEKQCVKERHPQRKANIRLSQHCAAISTTAELLFVMTSAETTHVICKTCHMALHGYIVPHLVGVQLAVYEIAIRNDENLERWSC